MLSVERLAPDVDEREGLIGGKPARELEDVLDGEGVDVDDQRLELRVARELRVVLNLVALGGDERADPSARPRAGGAEPRSRSARP